MYRRISYYGTNACLMRDLWTPDFPVLVGSLQSILNQAEKALADNKPHAASQWLTVFDQQIAAIARRYPSEAPPKALTVLQTKRDAHYQKGCEQHQQEQKALGDWHQEVQEVIDFYNGAPPVSVDDLHQFGIPILQAYLAGIQGLKGLFSRTIHELPDDKAVTAVQDKIQALEAKLKDREALLVQLETAAKALPDQLPAGTPNPQKAQALADIAEARKLSGEIDAEITALKAVVAERAPKPDPTGQYWHPGNPPYAAPPVPTLAEWQHMEKTSAAYYRERLEAHCKETLVKQLHVVTQTLGGFKAAVDTAGKPPTMDDLIKQEEALFKARMELIAQDQVLEDELRKLPLATRTEAYATIRNARQKLLAAEAQLLDALILVYGKMGEAARPGQGASEEENAAALRNGKSLALKLTDAKRDLEAFKQAPQAGNHQSYDVFRMCRVHLQRCLFLADQMIASAATKKEKAAAVKEQTALRKELFELAWQSLTFLTKKDLAKEVPTLSVADGVMQDYNRFLKDFNECASWLGIKDKKFLAGSAKFREAHTKFCQHTLGLLDKELGPCLERAKALTPKVVRTEAETQALTSIQKDLRAYLALVEGLLGQSNVPEIRAELEKRQNRIKGELRTIDKALDPNEAKKREKMTEKGVKATVIYSDTGVGKQTNVDIYVNNETKKYSMEPHLKARSEEIQATAVAVVKRMFEDHDRESFIKNGICISCTDPTNEKQLALTQALHQVVCARLEAEGYIDQVTISVVNGKGEPMTMAEPKAAAEEGAKLSSKYKYSLAGGEESEPDVHQALRFGI